MKYLIILTVFLLSLSCSKSDDNSRSNSSEWLIPVSEVLDGGPGKDGIPSVDNPLFDQVNQSHIEDSRLVIGVVQNGEAKAYPHNILDWHEIVNDNMGDLSYAITYCPLTGTGIAWNGEVNGVKTTFGVSGKLYNTNLMPYDRATDSYWSQIGLNSVNGESIGEIASTIPVIETTLATWVKAYPNTLVMNTETGFSRNYNAYPYGDYRTNSNNIIFPVSTLDDRLPAKERVLAVLVDDVTKVYSIELFGDGRIIEDNVGGKDIFVIGSKEDNYIVAYEKGSVGSLTFAEDQLPIIAFDQDGNAMQLNGLISGATSNVELKSVNRFMSFFFALSPFYEVEIYN